MKAKFMKKIEKNNKRIVKKVTKVAKKNPTAAVAITATAGTGFMGLGVLNVVQHMRNKKAMKKAKAMDAAKAASANTNNTHQHPVQKPQAEPTAPTTNETTTTASKTTTPGEQVFPALLQAAFNEFLCVRKDPRSKGWTDAQLADATARRFASDPLSISCIYTCIMENIEKINFNNLQNAVITNTAQATQTTEPNTFEVFNEPEETDNTNPDEGKYPASSKKQQHNGKKGNNNKKN